MSVSQSTELPEGVARAFEGAVQGPPSEEWGARLGGVVAAVDAAALARGGAMRYGELATAILRAHACAEGLAERVRDFCAGLALSRAGVHKRAQGLLERVATAGEPDGDADRRERVLRTWAMIELGFVRHRLGDTSGARALVSEAINRAVELANPHLEARGHHYIALVYERLRDTDSAREHLARALRIYRDVGSKSGEARVYDSLGLLSINAGDADQAEAWFERSLMLKQETGDDFGTAITLGQLGRLHAHLGNYEHALTFLSRDLELSRQFGDLNATMVLLNNIGDLHLARGDAQKALESYQRSLALAEKTRFERGIGFAKCCLTKAYVALGQIQEACAAADEAEAILDDVGERLGLGTLLTQRAQIESARQNYGLAEQYHERAISTFRELDMPAPLANALFECGLMFRDLGDIEKAAPRLREAIAVAERLQFQKLAQRYREAVETVEGRQWIEVVAELREARERLAEEHRRLQRKDAQLEWLTEMAVHDLKSPLQAITAALHGALEHPDDSRFSQEMVNLALDSARVLCEMVDDMLTVLGSESAALRPRLEPIQLREVVAAVTDQLRPSASQADVRLVQDVPESLPTINADPRLIRRVIVNLVGNAIKHTRDGEVRVTATEEPDAVVVTVADTGSGIPPDVQDRVFDMWFHAEEFARDRRVRGTGLGLPFCRAAVEAHGGRIWVKSELGRGSTFAFRLPLKSLAH